MITDSDDFRLWVYVIVDGIWQQIAPLFKRRGPAPICSDTKLAAHTLCIYIDRLLGNPSWLQIKALIER